MTGPRTSAGDPAPGPGHVLPRTSTSWAIAALSLGVVALTYWLALLPGAQDAQADFVRWVNNPPEPLNTILAVTNSLLRPVPLAVIAVLLLGWVMATVRGAARWEVVRAMALALLLSEVITQVLKGVAGQSRPTASIPGLDVHGYPKDPNGNAYPSAHTSVAVGLVAALWPWLNRPQRAVAITVAALVAMNRLYIGAHWPVDVVGGAAIGLFAGSVCWLVAARWPITRPRASSAG
jgi:undecaprenyl-diphosphatase